MLDINLDGLSQMNTVATWFLGSAVVLMVIGLVVGLTMLAMGKTKNTSKLSERGMATGLVAIGGAVVLGAIGGVVDFSDSLGTEELMPPEAGQQDVVIERQAPTTTCTDQAVRDFNDEEETLTYEEREDVLYEVAGDELFGQFELGARDNLSGVPVPGTAFISTIKWYPQGPGCSAENLTAAPGTEIQVMVQGGAGVQTVKVPEEL